MIWRLRWDKIARSELPGDYPRGFKYNCLPVKKSRFSWHPWPGLASAKSILHKLANVGENVIHTEWTLQTGLPNLKSETFA